MAHETFRVFKRKNLVVQGQVHSCFFLDVGVPERNLSRWGGAIYTTTTLVDKIKPAIQSYSCASIRWHFALGVYATIATKLVQRLQIRQIVHNQQHPLSSRKLHPGTCSTPSVSMRRGRHTQTYMYRHTDGRDQYTLCLKKRPAFSYDCSFCNCWSIFITFGTQYTELTCNITVIYLLTLPTYCCYNTLGNIGCISKGYTWIHKNWCPIIARKHEPHFRQSWH